MVEAKNKILFGDLRDRTSSIKVVRSKSSSIDKVIEETAKNIRASFVENTRKRKVSTK